MSDLKKCIVCDHPIEKLMIDHGYTLLCAACEGRQPTPLKPSELEEAVKAYNKRRDLKAYFAKRQG